MAGATAVGAAVAVPLGHQEAMILAATEFDRMAAQLQALSPCDWAQVSFRQFAHDVRAAGKRSSGKMLTAGHGGRLVADVVTEWGRRHGQPFALTLTGTAGGQWRSGEAGEHLQLDALDFCRIVAARQPGTGLMATKVPF